jgi:hypothetical protein
LRLAVCQGGADRRRKRYGHSSAPSSDAGVNPGDRSTRRGTARCACNSPRIGPPASTSATPANSAKKACSPIPPAGRTVDDTAMPEFGEQGVSRVPRGRALRSSWHGYLNAAALPEARVSLRRRERRARVRSEAEVRSRTWRTTAPGPCSSLAPARRRSLTSRAQRSRSSTPRACPCIHQFAGIRCGQSR